MSRRRGALLDVLRLLGVLTAVVGITHAYVSYERYFYFWDQAVYQDIAVRTAAAFRESLPAGWHALQLSFRDDYNALFALPLVPWLLAFGPSRISYELGLAILYLFPLPLCWGAVATEIVPGRPGLAFWGTAGFALLTPMTWVPVLRGYPDAAAATLLALALYLYLRDVELEDPVTWSMLGVLLGLSVLLRRHFAFAVAAFLLSAAVRALGAALVATGPAALRTRRLAIQALRLCLLVAVAAAATLLVAHESVRRMLAYDFPALYRSYEEPLGAVLRWYVAPYGWLAWLVAALGFGLGLLSSQVHRPRVAFLLLFGAVSGVQWCWRVRQIGEQYTLHFTPFIVLGWLLLCVVAWDSLPGLPGGCVVGLLLGIGLVNLFLGLSYPDRTRELLVRPLFAARWAPLVRFDYDEMLRLAGFLRGASKPDAGVYVVASSVCLNPDILRQADAMVAGASPERLNVLATPLVDSDGFYPLGELLEAQFVVLARPFQHHLPAREQDVVKALYDAFDTGGELARDFSQAPAGYPLMGCTATVFERQRPTSLEGALAARRALLDAVPERPGMQPDWVVVGERFPSWLTRNADGSARWAAHPTLRVDSISTSLATLGPLSGALELSGVVRFTDPTCRGVTLSLAAPRSALLLEPLAELSRRPGEDGHFALQLQTRGADPLLLSLVEYAPGSTVEDCMLILDPLSLRPVTASPGPPAAGAP